MAYLLHVLPEIQENIFSYCNSVDLRRLACCNSEYNKALKETLWETVDIPLRSLQDDNCKNRSKCKNLQFTKIIQFHSDHSGLLKFDPYSNRKGKDKKMLKKMSANYRKVLSYCNEEKLDTLWLAGVVFNGADMKYSFKEFNTIKHLTVTHAMHIEASEFEVIKGLHDLVGLKLMYTTVGDAFLAAICDKLVNLKSLSVRRCNEITNQGLASLKKLSFLETLDISGCTEIYNEGISYISTLINLKTLDISHCSGISDEGILHLSNLSLLRDVNISWCREITNESLHGLTQLKSLRRLNTSSCPSIGDKGLSSICIIASLQEVNFNGCVSIGDPGILTASNKLSDLRKLHIVYTDVTDIGLKYLTNLRFLVELDVTGCTRITDLGISYLTTFSCLRNLNISCTQVTNDGLEHLLLLTNLRVLNVSSCKHLTDQALSHISNVMSLQDLDIACTSITDAGLKHLNTLKYLRRLRCRESEVSIDGLSELRLCVSVKEIDSGFPVVTNTH